jgi:glucose-6-phosphate isomerase
MALDWTKLQAAAQAARGRRILDLLDDPARAGDFSVEAGGLFFDYSKTQMTAADRALLIAMAGEAGVAARRDAMFGGAKINDTEGRAVLHTALRNLDGGPVMVDGQDVMPGVRDARTGWSRFARRSAAAGSAAQGGAASRTWSTSASAGRTSAPKMAAIALAPYHDGPR